MYHLFHSANEQREYVIITTAQPESHLRPQTARDEFIFYPSICRKTRIHTHQTKRPFEQVKNRLQQVYPVTEYIITA